MNNQEEPATFDTSTWYALGESGYTHSVNIYFEIYIQYKTPIEGDYTWVNGIRGIIKPKGIGSVVLNLEYNIGKIHSSKKKAYFSLVAPKVLTSPERWARDRGEYWLNAHCDVLYHILILLNNHLVPLVAWELVS